MTIRMLTLPGWQNSNADHWQTHWERRFAFKRVEQADWHWQIGRAHV